MKYINADKLIAEVERRKEKWLAELRLIRKGKDKAMYAAGKSSGYTEFLSLIDSLQQEQPQVADASKMEQPGAPICGEVLNDGEHLPGLTVDSAQLHDRLKGFPDGTDVYIFIVAKEENHSGAV